MPDEYPKLGYFAVFLFLFASQLFAFWLFLWHPDINAIGAMSDKTGVLPKSYPFRQTKRLFIANPFIMDTSSISLAQKNDPAVGQ
jgi:hypothetical protein